MLQINTLLKSVSYNVFNNSDLGGQSKKEAENCILAGTHYKDTSDPLTCLIVKSVNEANDLEDIESNINYAIGELMKAKNNALYGQLKMVSQS